MNTNEYINRCFEELVDSVKHERQTWENERQALLNLIKEQATEISVLLGSTIHRHPEVLGIDENGDTYDIEPCYTMCDYQ